MSHYIIVVYSTQSLKRVLRAIQRNSKARLMGIAIMVYTEDARWLGGIKNIDRENIVIFKGYIPLPQS